MFPFVPAIMASLGSLTPEEQENTAILFLENFIVTTTVSSTPAITYR